MKLFVQYKDPDAYMRSEDGIEEQHNLPDDVINTLYEMGIKEYLALVVDTETKEVRVLKRGEKFADSASH